MVSIIPGIETAAPERTETSSGRSLPPKCRLVAASSRCRLVSTWERSQGGNCRVSR